jgi:hypothetical protein
MGKPSPTIYQEAEAGMYSPEQYATMDIGVLEHLLYEVPPAEGVKIRNAAILMGHDALYHDASRHLHITPLQEEMMLGLQQAMHGRCWNPFATDTASNGFYDSIKEKEETSDHALLEKITDYGVRAGDVLVTGVAAYYRRAIDAIQKHIPAHLQGLDTLDEDQQKEVDEARERKIADLLNKSHEHMNPAAVVKDGLFTELNHAIHHYGSPLKEETAGHALFDMYRDAHEYTDQEVLEELQIHAARRNDPTVAGIATYLLLAKEPQQDMSPEQMTQEGLRLGVFVALQKDREHFDITDRRTMLGQYFTMLHGDVSKATFNVDGILTRYDTLSLQVQRQIQINVLIKEGYLTPVGQQQSIIPAAGNPHDQPHA